MSEALHAQPWRSDMSCAVQVALVRIHQPSSQNCALSLSTTEGLRLAPECASNRILPTYLEHSFGRALGCKRFELHMADNHFKARRLPPQGSSSRAFGAMQLIDSIRSGASEVLCRVYLPAAS